MSNLIERLKHGAIVVGQAAVEDGTSTLAADLLSEAADAIEQLQAGASLAEIALDAQTNRVDMRQTALAAAQAETERLTRVEQFLAQELKDEQSARRVKETAHVSGVWRALAAAQAERDNAYKLFPPLLKEIDHALNGPDPDDLTVRGYTTLPERARKVVAALAEARRVLRLVDKQARRECPVCFSPSWTHGQGCALAAVLLAQDGQS